MHRSILGHVCSASSAIALRGITLSPRKLPSAVIKTAHFASFIRVAKADDEKPAKTTE